MNSLIGWVGGKRLLASTIVELLPEHTCYVEVFGGAGWVLFRKDPDVSDVEIYNDVNSRLVELFRSVKWHPQEIVRELDFLAPSREIFNQFKEQPGLTEIQRAARFYYVIKLSFGCKGGTPGFNSSSPKRLIMSKVMSDIERVRERLERGSIENRDFDYILDRYDKSSTVFFCDPPYYEAEDCYDAVFTEDDHNRLADRLHNIDGRFLLTYNDHEWVRNAYQDDYRYAVTADYTISNKGSTAGHQLIITNYELTPPQLEAAPKSVALLDQVDGPA